MVGIIIGSVLGGLFLLLIAVLLIRAALFVPHERTVPVCEKSEIDEAWAANNLAAMIRCKTVSEDDKSLECEEEFLKFENTIKELFPSVFEKCEFEKVSDRALLFKWKGRSEGTPTVLMSHYDVVSVDEEKWEKPAFEGIIEDGILWGRGTIDTKGTLNGVLSAAEILIKDGFTPERDIYFAFAGDEEVNGHGACDIVKIFKEKGIEPALVLDEGGAVVTNVFPGVKAPCAVIGIAEKGMLNIEYSYDSRGGHASAPKPHTPVGVLSAACVKLENSPMKFKITKPTAMMFDTLGRHSTFVYRLIFANLWLFAPVLNYLGKKQGGQINAVARTTLAFTQMQGSAGINVIPPTATMGSNSRILPGETVEQTVERIRKIINNDDIKLTVLDSREPSRISTTECEGYERITSSVSEIWPEALVSPYLMTACSDARNWSDISDKVYRFSPMRLSNEENATIHGNNERIPVAHTAETVKFYISLIKKS